MKTPISHEPINFTRHSCAQTFARNILNARSLAHKRMIGLNARAFGEVFCGLVGMYVYAGATAQRWAGQWKN